MTKPARGESSVPDERERKRLVLGFDAGCGTCADIAGRVESRIGGRIEVRNLRDPEIAALRERALGKNARWAPTLLMIDGDRVRAWTGWRMGWTLSRSIGAAATWRVMQALGEVGVAPQIEESVAEKLPASATDAVIGMSRGRFLTGLGGAAVAMSVMSGTNLIASPARAARRRKRPYDIVDSWKIRGEELRRISREAGSAVDVKNMVGDALSSTNKVEAAEPEAFGHKFRNGTKQRVIVYRVSDDRRLGYVEYSDPPKDRGATQAIVWRKDGRRWVVAKGSESGELWRRASNNHSLAQSAGSGPLDECPPVISSGGACYVKSRRCVTWSNSGACAGGAIGTSVGCVLCAGSVVTGAPTGSYSAEGAGGACGGCLAGVVALTDCCLQYGDVYVQNYGTSC